MNQHPSTRVGAKHMDNTHRIPTSTQMFRKELCTCPIRRQSSNKLLRKPPGHKAIPKQSFCPVNGHEQGVAPPDTAVQHTSLHCIACYGHAMQFVHPCWPGAQDHCKSLARFVCRPQDASSAVSPGAVASTPPCSLVAGLLVLLLMSLTVYFWIGKNSLNSGGNSSSLYRRSEK